MKQNGNDRQIGDYYVGLDVGTNSVGWAVTDPEYHVLRCRSRHMWGTRLFEEASGAAGRRTSRTARRRLERRKQRLLILEMLFAEEIAKADPDFFVRLHESDLWQDDKKTGSKFSLFNDPGYTDRDYHKAYPTIYHLRSELANGSGKHDIRLVFLALHHLMKYRGHFLDADSGADEIRTVRDVLNGLLVVIREELDFDLILADPRRFTEALADPRLGVRAKAKELAQAMGPVSLKEETGMDPAALCTLLAGGKTQLSRLFTEGVPEEAGTVSVFLKDDPEEKKEDYDKIPEELLRVILSARDVFDAARLSVILSGHRYICDAKVALYRKNAEDLRLFKKMVRAYIPGSYRRIFTERKKDLKNYAAYSGYQAKSGDGSCTQEEFCKFLRGEIAGIAAADERSERILNEIREGSFLPKLRSTENGLIPYQLQKREIEAILHNASEYLPFLMVPDKDGNTPADKLIKTFEYRIPYYVGPLNQGSPRGWHVRFPGMEKTQVTPWNFDQVINKERSAEIFIENLIGICPYTGEPVLPKDSLLYSEFMLRNELNPLRVNGHPLPHEVRERMIDALFIQNAAPVTKKKIHEFLLANGYIEKADEITGIDDRIKTTLKSRHDMKALLEKTGSEETVEKIIRSIVVFGKDKKMLGKWLKKNVPELDESDIRYLSRLSYEEWGNLSEYFLAGIYSDPDEDGEIFNIITMLRKTDNNLMQLLSSRFSYAEKAQRHRDERVGNTESLDERLESMYVAPAVRRSIHQTVRIVDEIVDIRKAAPKKIFIEMARGDKNKVLQKRTESRKDTLKKLYAKCEIVGRELAAQLESEDDNKLRSDKLFLYYTQLGRCMYTGEPIDLEALMRGQNYDIDHIYPRSRIKDDSLDNRVLVKNTENREKTNIYPVRQEIRSNMAGFWKKLKKANLISGEKYDRLVRSTPLNEDELSDFVARQLTQTRQSTKALAELLKTAYPETRIVYSKAGNVADFRQEFKIVKCREVNDLHHARDAYLNIVVGNVYDTKFTEKFFRNILNENYSIRVEAIFKHDVPGAWQKDRTIAVVKKMVSVNDPLVTRLPVKKGGELFDLNIMPAGKGQLEKKAGMPIERYGGYNKLSASYYCVVESTEKKKRVRSIEPVYLYCSGRYDKDPVEYCKSILNLTDPVIIIKCLRINALVEFENRRMYLTARTGDRIVMEHAYQLAVNSEIEKLIKDIAKYTERCAARKTELTLTERDGIDADSLTKLYDFFEEKCGSAVYESFFGALKKHIRENRVKFESMSLLERCRILLEILKAFRCDATYPNLKELCGVGLVGRITYSKQLEKLGSACLVHQSVTGLYEYRTDLLGDKP